MTRALARRWPEAVVAAPALSIAVMLMGLDSGYGVTPDATHRQHRAASLASAIAGGESVETVYGFVRAGDDPDQLVHVAIDGLTGGGDVEVSPLVLAVATRDQNVVQMLLGFGVRPDRPQNRLAWCLALALQEPAIAAAIDGASVSVSREACPAGPPPSSPLAWFARAEPREPTAGP